MCLLSTPPFFFWSVLLRLHRSFKVSIGLDEASCPEAGGSPPAPKQEGLARDVPPRSALSAAVILENKIK